MFRFDYGYTDYKLLLKGLARKMNAPVIDHKLNIPPEFGSGTYTVLTLPNRLHAGLLDCTINNDWYVHRKKTTEKFYVLRFDELFVPGTLIVTIDDQNIQQRNINTSRAYLTSSMFDWSYFGSKGSHYRGVTILFRKNWLAEYLDLPSTRDVLAAYISLKAGNINIEPLDAQYKQWMKEIFETDEGHPLRITIIQNRIMLMIERFFDHVITKMRNPSFHVSLSQEDIDRVVKIESILTKDLYESPPTIQQLAKTASVSESKLKKDFKTMYGVPIYTYYQNARMKMARSKLLTGKYSVKEVGLEIGYGNLSNFSTAFKKQFGVLPGKLRGKEKNR